MTTIEKIEKIVLPSLRKGLEMEEKATPGPWKIDGDGEHGFGNASTERWSEDWKDLFATTESGSFSGPDARFIAHVRNEWRKVIQALIEEIEWLKRIQYESPQTPEEFGRNFQFQSRLQSIANLWPDEV